MVPAADPEEDFEDTYVPGRCELCDYDRGNGLWYDPCPHREQEEEEEEDGSDRA